MTLRFQAGDRVVVASIDQNDPKWVELGMCGTVVQSVSEAPWVRFDAYIGTETVYADKEGVPGWKPGHMECLTHGQLRKIHENV